MKENNGLLILRMLVTFFMSVFFCSWFMHLLDLFFDTYSDIFNIIFFSLNLLLCVCDFGCRYTVFHTFDFLCNFFSWRLQNTFKRFESGMHLCDGY